MRSVRSAPTFPDGDLAGRIVGPPMHHTLRGMGLGEHADAAIAAYRADYTTRGWAMNSLFDGIAATARRPARRRCAAGGGHVEGRADRPRIIEHFGLDGHFEVVAGASLDGVRATKADVVAHALAQLEPLPERVLMVGDRVPRRRRRRRTRHRHRGRRLGLRAGRLRRARRRHRAGPRGDGRRPARGARCLSTGGQERSGPG